DYVDAVYMALAAAVHARQTQQDQVDGVYALADYVDAVYMVLAAAARTQASAARNALDYVDAVYMVLAAAAHTRQTQHLGNSTRSVASAARNALAWNLRPTQGNSKKDQRFAA
ncbi:unnamed protein product, partial [Effrenium voratum]